jgi:hypothetical protein
VFAFFCKCEDSSNRASKNLLCCLYVNRFFVEIGAIQLELDDELVSYARKALLQVVRARYIESIHNGKIGNSVMASKILLYSIDVANDHCSRALVDWECVESSMTPNPWILRMLRYLDEFMLLFNVNSGWVSFIDAFNERNALYVLINYIDAHEHALNKLHFIMGEDERDSRHPGSNGQFSKLEESQVILETVTAVSALCCAIYTPSLTLS